MFFSKIVLKRSALSYTKLAQMVGYKEYKAHSLIWDLFSRNREQKRSFIYASEKSQTWPIFYAVSDVKPYDEKGLWNIQVKPYNPQMSNRQRLQFLLTANPVITKQGNEGGHARHDIIMNAKTLLKERGIPKNEWPPLTEFIHREGFSWLSKRSEKHGFSVNDKEVTVDSYEKHRFYKNGLKKPISLSSLTFSGILTVTDPQAFLNALFYGIGPAKGFGFGMLMVKRAYV